MINKLLDKYIYLKLCWSQAMNHLSIPSQIFDKAVLVAVFLKAFNITEYALVYIIGGLGVIGAFFFGHMILTINIMKREVSLANKHNPEMQELLKINGGKSSKP
jgi:hypothetical protein